MSVGVPEWAHERVYDATSEQVWNCWTDPSLFARWYGPNVETIIHKMDVKPGGECHLELKWQDQSFFQKFEYLEVTPHERLVWAQANADKNWEVIPSPQLENWPIVLISTMSINLELGKPQMRFTWSPFKATPTEITTFKNARLEMDAAWNTAFSILDNVIDELKHS